MKRILYSINRYDKDGDITDTGVFLHFGDVCIKVAGSPEQFENEVLNQIERINQEIWCNQPQ